MKIAELIKQLQQLDPEATIVVLKDVIEHSTCVQQYSELEYVVTPVKDLIKYSDNLNQYQIK